MHIVYRDTNNGKYFVRFDKGEELLRTLVKFALQESTQGAFLTGIGGVQEIILAHYDLNEKSYHDMVFHGNLELASLTGTITILEGAPVIHLHGVIGREDKSALAGHIRRAIVGGTCEIFIEKFSSDIMRERDEETGLLRLI